MGKKTKKAITATAAAALLFGIGVAVWPSKKVQIPAKPAATITYSENKLPNLAKLSKAEVEYYLSLDKDLQQALRKPFMYKVDDFQGQRPVDASLIVEGFDQGVEDFVVDNYDPKTNIVWLSSTSGKHSAGMPCTPTANDFDGLVDLVIQTKKGTYEFDVSPLQHKVQRLNYSKKPSTVQIYFHRFQITGDFNEKVLKYFDSIKIDIPQGNRFSPVRGKHFSTLSFAARGLSRSNINYTITFRKGTQILSLHYTEQNR